MGMPGLEKGMARYAQLYSRVGFVHLFRPLATNQLQRVIAHKWDQLGLPFCPTAEALAAIMRITQGNFRLIELSWLLPTSAPSKGMHYPRKLVILGGMCEVATTGYLAMGYPMCHNEGMP